MAQGFTICVGTVGAGVWFSPDSGDHWRRSKMDLPFLAEPGEIQIRALAVSPVDRYRDANELLEDRIARERRDTEKHLELDEAAEPTEEPT